MKKNFPEYKHAELTKIADEVLSFWNSQEIFKKSIDYRNGQPSYTFYEGPPSANGKPGIHHVMARAVKDLFCRYKTQTGYQVIRKAGWDTHGLPVELQVEKELGITKDDIGKKISVEEYNQKCREAVMKYTDDWNHLTQIMGYWVDLEKPYVTYEANYMESIWYLLKMLYDKGLLYKGFTIQPYSPAAGTGLSSHELNQPGCYRDVKDTSITAQFKVVRNEKSAFLFDSEQEEVYCLAWTTTPWTLPSNSALAVGEKIEYTKVKTFNPYTHKPVSVVLASARAPYFFQGESTDGDLVYSPEVKKLPWKHAGKFLGSALLGVDYEQLMPYVQPNEKAFLVIAGDFVTTDDGTGIVHIAPTFGADDYRVAKQAGIPAILVKDELANDVPLVNKKGAFVAEVTDFAGLYVKNYDDKDESSKDYKSTDVLISILLKEQNKAFKVEKYEHSYPHCWRTDKPILYYPLESWFIKTSSLKDRLVALNKTINWQPENTGIGRFGNWLENLVDWNLSRSRYWGTPLPIWRSDDLTEEKCIGSINELKSELEAAIDSGKLSEDNKAANLLFLQKIAKGDTDLHRPYVDDIALVSSTGQVMKRESDLIDVWFDSGAMPFAQWHYPFENQEIFQENYPADFIAEGIDQTRGWFYTLHAISGLLFDSVAFKNVIANGLVLDKNGNKMSKRLGNTIDPFLAIGTQGPDAIRWYMIVNAPPWDNLKYDPAGVDEVIRKFFGTLQNTYNFFALYANLDGFRGTPAPDDLDFVPYTERQEIDHWILARLNDIVTQTRKALDNYDPTLAARTIQDFVIEDVSNWYVRLNRKRFWKGEYNQDKKAAYQTLYTVLETVARLVAPFAPFYAERLYRDLSSTANAKESVHLTDYPQSIALPQDLDVPHLLGTTQAAQIVSSLIHSLRKKNNLKVRLPLSKAEVVVPHLQAAQWVESAVNLIKEETNLKEITVSRISHTAKYSVLPNLPVLGKEYGKQLGSIKMALTALVQDQIIELHNGGSIELRVDEQVIKLTSNHVLIKSENLPGFDTAHQGVYTVGLDLEVTQELKEEGLARDLVNRIQNFRKDSGYAVTEKIAIVASSDQEWVLNAMRRFQTYIMDETQAVDFQIIPADDASKFTVVDIDGIEIGLSVASQTLVS